VEADPELGRLDLSRTIWPNLDVCRWSTSTYGDPLISPPQGFACYKNAVAPKSPWLSAEKVRPGTRKNAIFSGGMEGRVVVRSVLHIVARQSVEVFLPGCFGRPTMPSFFPSINLI